VGCMRMRTRALRRLTDGLHLRESDPLCADLNLTLPTHVHTRTCTHTHLICTEFEFELGVEWPFRSANSFA